MHAAGILRITKYTSSLLIIVGLLAAPTFSYAQETQTSASQDDPEHGREAPQSPSPTHQTQNAQQAPSTPNLIDTEEAGESDQPEIPRKFVHWNEYEGPYFTIRAGAGLLYEFSAYAQDEQSKQQFALDPDSKVRDFRFLLRGRFPQFKRPVTWSAGIMYDGVTNSWLIRETGVMIGFPKLKGYLFVGRTKLGFSLNKVMVGYAGWTLERFTMSDATVPILGDGVKWLGYSQKHGLLWNIGYYNDFLSKSQSFNLYHNQAVGRFAWLPIHSEEKDEILHLGVDFLYGTSEGNKLRLRSRPEAFPAPYFIDTGTFTASASRMLGYEAYYRRKSLLFGSEYWFDSVTSNSGGNPVFRGGEVVATWIVTGESRAYNTVGGYFTAVSPANPVLNGGPGAWEIVGRYSNTDLNGGTISGGKFWRFTPGVNWYLSKSVRLSIEYGYGQLQRFNLNGRTQFFQSRLQLQL